jgi:hypothetical protein
MLLDSGSLCETFGHQDIPKIGNSEPLLNLADIERSVEGQSTTSRSFTDISASPRKAD